MFYTTTLRFIWDDLIGAAKGVYKENVPCLSYIMKRQTAAHLAISSIITMCVL